VRDFPQPVKPCLVEVAFIGTAKQAMEKGVILSEKLEKHTSRTEALFDSIGFIPEMNPRPTAPVSFSASCKAAPFQNPTSTASC
jgi:hypothetical protein